MIIIWCALFFATCHITIWKCLSVVQPFVWPSQRRDHQGYEVKQERAAAILCIALGDLWYPTSITLAFYRSSSFFLKTELKTKRRWYRDYLHFHPPSSSIFQFVIKIKYVTPLANLMLKKKEKEQSYIHTAVYNKIYVFECWFIAARSVDRWATNGFMKEKRKHFE